jgi:hypothetical protein
MSRFVTVGFDTEARASSFLEKIKGAGLLIRLYERYQEGEETKGRVHNIQARSAHEWTPREYERRAFEFAGVVIEFKDQQMASEFTVLVAQFISGARSKGDLDALEHLTDLLRGENIAGVRLEKE